ncbi:nucleotide exchange factor GrpE [Natranaerobius trueperi]|nr:nucleotide exchange factor GrpE [Natranaerobius trueperi]
MKKNDNVNEKCGQEHQEEVDFEENSEEKYEQEQNVTYEELQNQFNDLVTEKEKLTEERDQYLNQLRRLQADFDNYKRRVSKEWDKKSLEKAEEVVGDILGVLDNFERALQNASEDVDEQYQQGVKMIYDQLYEVLKKHGLEKIDAQGETFDPNYHQAVMQVESEDHESNIVVEELQPGFLFKGRLLRPSVVKVSK